jgi:hypothetical protein
MGDLAQRRDLRDNPSVANEEAHDSRRGYQSRYQKPVNQATGI